MRALENRALFAGFPNDREKRIEMHHERVKTIKKVVDTSAPQSIQARCSSPSKRLVTKQALRERIIRDNLQLARKIFKIMEGHSEISEMVNDTRHIDAHPGTMNFKQRLAEAQRIHARNMLLASRLETVQPYYKVADLTIPRPVKKKPIIKKNKKKSKFKRELNMVLKGERGIANAGEMTHRSTGHDGPVVGALKFSKLAQHDSAMQSQSARKADYGNPRSMGGSADSESRTEYQRTRPSNVLLEYTKIQDGRVLDVAVLKEPFRDRYAIFGIDVDDGQRYELRLTSDEVSSILDGDMLVTSVDNVEVWMALLNKVTLQRVGFFARLPFTADEVDNYNSNNNSASASSSPTGRSRQPQSHFPLQEDAEPDENEESVPYHYTLATTDPANVSPPLSPVMRARSSGGDPERPALVPSAPGGSRPSNDRPMSRGAATVGNKVTSAAGAVRLRHQQSGGGNDEATENDAVGAGASVKSKIDKSDPILSLFADSGMETIEDARTDLATPGFLQNAVSATVTIVPENADFPEAPVMTNFEPVQMEPDEPLPISSKVQTARKTVPAKPSSQKVSGTTRAASMRAAAVRRRSIETEQSQNGGKPVAVAGLPPAGLDAEDKAAIRTELNKKRLAKEEAAKNSSAGSVVKPKSATGTRVAPIQHVTSDSEEPGVPATLVPSKPKPPSAAKPSSMDHNSDAVTSAPRPKSRLYTPKAPNSSDGSNQPPHSSLKTGSRVPTETGEKTVSNDTSALVPPTSPNRGGARPKSNGESRGTPSRPKSGPSSQLSPQAPVSRPKSSGRNRLIVPSEQISESVNRDASVSVSAVSNQQSVPHQLSEQAMTTQDSNNVPKTEEDTVGILMNENIAEDTTDRGAPAITPQSDAAIVLSDTLVPAAAQVALPHEDGSESGAKEEDGSAALKSAGQSVVASTPLDYSMDFENSSANAEVFKVHD